MKGVERTMLRSSRRTIVTGKDSKSPHRARTRLSRPSTTSFLSPRAADSASLVSARTAAGVIGSRRGVWAETIVAAPAARSSQIPGHLRAIADPPAGFDVEGDGAKREGRLVAESGHKSQQTFDVGEVAGEPERCADRACALPAAMLNDLHEARQIHVETARG